MTLAIQDDTVPNIIPKDDAVNAVGIDMGLKSFLVKSDGSEVAIPPYSASHTHEVQSFWF